MKNSGSKGQETDFEVRPSGMLVQQRDVDGGDAELSASGVPTIKIKIAHDSALHEVHVPANSTFGELKKEIAQKTGLEPEKQQVLFRGNEKEDKHHLDTVGVKDNSKILVMEVQPTKQKVEEKVTKEMRESEEIKESEEMSKAFAAVAGVRSEVDKLSERVAALEVTVNSGTKVSEEEFDVSAELLMRQLLKLDGIEAEGEARLQRKAEVRRVQNFHETLDNLKARNANPFSDGSKAVTVTTNWETFENGVGSLTPPNPSSTKVTEDWEHFD